ncbi:ABC transporter permease subunit [Streptomyces sp. 3MP-14]|uniref:ABC transporter permease subunit n=1 Tax=Streptomyces mimosae TaxID=2586635 RepID=A0A5N6A7S3_9ACTN|nr:MULTISPECIES: carbohydrate ABC transporter permease [Streptomyces]KAB8164302.1 ABC transporter permease subunit [Streptomyces mimosae]KAB8176579.1 ABC transporter permease subunit [Streptomyces sp. 3MP-14]
MSTEQLSRAARPPRVRIARVFGYLLLIVISAASAYPLLWMLITSVRPRNTVFGGGFLPDEFTFDAYRQAWTDLNFPRHFMITLVITVITVLGVVALATLAGYAFAHLEFRGQQFIYVTLLSTIMLPVTAIVIPLFLELDALGLLGSQTGLVLVYIGTSVPFAMFLMRVFFETLPHELVQAARVDGAGEFAIFARVMLPLAAPGAATVVIFQFMNTWNEFLFAQTFLKTPEQLPLQPVLYAAVGQHSTDWPLLCASLTMSILPIIMVYMRMQRRFVAGMTLGAVKS